MKLTTESELAEEFGLSLEKIRAMRQRKGWPHVKLSRFDVRYTDAQVAEIVAKHTVKPAVNETDRLAERTGLTRAGAARARR